MSSPVPGQPLSYGYDLLGGLRKDLKTLQGFGTVIQELLQNAEDACDLAGNPASQFWLDFRDDGLWVGNDGVFTDSNFEAIARIGAGSKRYDEKTIGSFGVGFVSVYQITDQPEIYSGRQQLVLSPLDGKAYPATDVDHPWPSTFRLPWADSFSEVRQRLEAQPVDRKNIENYIEDARRAFAECAVFLRHLKTLRLLQNGQPKFTLKIARPDSRTTRLEGSDGQVITFRRLDIALSDELLAEAQQRGRKKDLTLAYPVKFTSKFTGRLYAYLPTREESHLPVHVNADFYPNTDRKSLLWDEADKRSWNERLLQAAAAAMPEVLTDLQDISGTEAVYDFAHQVYRDNEQLSSNHVLKAFTGAAWDTCFDAFQELELFEGRDGSYVDHGSFLIIRYPHSELLPELLERQLRWILPPEKHQKYGPLFEVLEADELHTANFFGALDRLFSNFPIWLLEHALPALDVLKVFFDYLKELDEHEHDKLSEQLDSLDSLFVALNVNRRPSRIQDLWVCPPLHLKTVQPWLSDNDRVADEWLKAAPSQLWQRVPRYLPEDFCDALREETPESIQAYVQSGWELQGAYRFLQSGQNLGSQRLRSLPIYKTQAGSLSDGTQLRLSEGFTDPFGVCEALAADSLQGFPSLLERLHLEPLNAATYYGELLPQFFGERPDLRRDIIEHLAKKYQSVNLDPWRQLECVECQDGQWRIPGDCYFPNQLMQSLFGNHYPAFREEAYSGSGIDGLFLRLGVRNQVDEGDIVEQLDSRKFEPLTDETVQLRQTIFEYALAQASVTLSQKLSGVSWLPNERRTGWYQPTQLYRDSAKELIGKPANAEFCGFPLPKEKRNENLAALRFAIPKVPQLIEHIRVLNKEGKGPSGRMLDWLNKKVANLTDEDVAVLRRLQLFPYKDKDQEQKFDVPDKFFTKDPGLGRWRHSLRHGFYPPLVKRLNIPESPDLSTYQDILLSIASEREQRGSLSKEDFDVASTCFHKLSQSYSSLDSSQQERLCQALQRKRIVPVTRENGRGDLNYPMNTLYPDMPDTWFERFKFDKQHPNYVRGGHANVLFLKALGVSLLSENHTIEYVSATNSTFRPIRALDHRLDSYIPALLRFLFKEFHEDSLPEFQTLLKSLHFFQSEKISAKVTAKSSYYYVSSQCDLDAAFDAQTNRLIVADAKPRLGAEALAEALGLPTGAVRATLFTLWNSTTLREVDEILNAGAYPDLPEAFQPVHVAGAVAIATDEEWDDEDWNRAVDRINMGSETRGQVVGQPLTQQPNLQRKAERQSSSVPKSSAERKNKSVSSADPHRSAPPPKKSTIETHFGPSPFAGPSPSTERDGHRPQSPQGTVQPKQGNQNQAGQRRGQKQFKNYVYTYNESDREITQEAHSQKVDRRGMEYAMEYERRHNRTPEDCSADTGAGYDIFSTELSGEVRYIELKTVSGPWGDLGVTLSRNQLAAARKYGERYWLYVIEDLDGQPKLHAIQHPEGQVTYYVFDGSWHGNASYSEELTL
ncbi:DUF3883 domain-containing protein [Deinococcus radiophilus]|uniref:DUF3883 domain-containing protein n=1 Tax=Deinococcus radiophilus TaxID=32062 RepID=UPI001E406D23|nr:DUF3883 domain-containing protein [Deinococcus radiophilus]UFA51995.1 DUF3883 domain-containing protein [Deinococcus radiophilus]